MDARARASSSESPDDPRISQFRRSPVLPITISAFMCMPLVCGCQFAAIRDDMSLREKIEQNREWLARKEASGSDVAGSTEVEAIVELKREEQDLLDRQNLIHVMPEQQQNEKPLSRSSIGNLF